MMDVMAGNERLTRQHVFTIVSRITARGHHERDQSKTRQLAVMACHKAEAAMRCLCTVIHNCVTQTTAHWNVFTGTNCNVSYFN